MIAARLSEQLADGTWANFNGGPSELSTSTEAYVVLRLAGDQPDDPHMRRLEACQSPVGDTALAIIALTDAGTSANDAAIVRAADWLLEQEVRTPGDWAVRRPGLGLGGWAFEFANDNYPDVDDTAEVGLALRRVRHPDPGRLDAALRRAVAWLEAHQNADGGWGEDLRSYEDPAWIGRGASTASQTAWALMALLEADQDSPAVARGVDYLLRTQRQDGTWDEELYTGTGFPGAFYISYHLYRLVYPLMALGRYAKKVGRDEDGM